MRQILLPLIVIFLLSCSTKDHTSSNPTGAYMTVNGTKLYYERQGKGSLLLLLCGGGMDRSVNDFQKCVPALAEKFTVIAVDTPGQGKSEQLDTMTYATIAETMSMFIDSLMVDSVDIMGWSDGGIVGIMLAGNQPKVRRVIAVGPNNGKRGFNIPATVPLDSVVALSTEAYAKMNPDEIKRYSETPGRDWKRMVEDGGAMWYANEYFSPEIYKKIHIPLMIVLGDRDMITIEHGLEMTRAIEGAQFCVLPNTTHEVFAERPDLINQIAFEFFQRGGSTVR